MSFPGGRTICIINYIQYGKLFQSLFNANKQTYIKSFIFIIIVDVDLNDGFCSYM